MSGRNLEAIDEGQPLSKGWLAHSTGELILVTPSGMLNLAGAVPDNTEAVNTTREQADRSAKSTEKEG